MISVEAHAEAHAKHCRMANAVRTIVFTILIIITWMDGHDLVLLPRMSPVQYYGGP